MLAGTMMHGDGKGGAAKKSDSDRRVYKPSSL